MKKQRKYKRKMNKLKNKNMVEGNFKVPRSGTEAT
jgi:hypothetical protein